MLNIESTSSIWSKDGIVKRGDGARALVARDPDVGAFVELFEKP